MKTPKLHQPAQAAVLAIADIKAAVNAFDRGEINVFEALEAVLAAVVARDMVVRARERAARPRTRAA